MLLGLRVFVMQRVQQKRQRENRQETERLRSLVAAYRSLAGSFSPAAHTDRAQIEEALADIVLFGSIRQVKLAAQCATALVRAEPADCQVLVEELRSDLRTQLGLEAIPPNLLSAAIGAGVLVTRRPWRRRGPRRGGDTQGTGAVGGGGEAAAGAGGLSAGLIAADAGSRQEQ